MNDVTKDPLQDKLLRYWYLVPIFVRTRTRKKKHQQQYYLLRNGATYTRLLIVVIRRRVLLVCDLRTCLPPHAPSWRRRPSSLVRPYSRSSGCYSLLYAQQADQMGVNKILLNTRTCVFIHSSTNYSCVQQAVNIYIGEMGREGSQGRRENGQHTTQVLCVLVFELIHDIAVNTYWYE